MVRYTGRAKKVATLHFPEYSRKLGSASEWFTTAKSVQELKSAILSQRGNDSHKSLRLCVDWRFEVSVNGGVALKTKSSLMADISSMFVK